MFPTHVGMNRKKQFALMPGMGVPHTRGDEPRESGALVKMAEVFPTHVGMNRRGKRNT